MERIKAIIFLVIGLFALAGSVAAAMSVKRFIADSVTAQGRVTRLNAGGSHPEITFATLSGQTISFPEGGWIGGYKAGDLVVVRYRASDPSLSAQLDSFGSLWFWPTLLGLFGAVFTTVGLLGVIKR